MARQEAASPVVNYAATADHRDVREAAGAMDLYAPALPEQIPVMKELARRAMRNGAVGVGFGLNYSPGALSVQTEFIPEEEIVMGILSPLGIISSEGGGLVDGTGHPRSVGTFARFLGRYVRDQEVVGWMEGIRRITLLPAQRLEKAMPAMRTKGRLQEGMDADITVFDPATVQERATYQNPDQRSAGIPYVIVNGVVVLDGGEEVREAAPGRWLGRPAGR